MWKRTQRTIKARSVENRVFQIEQDDYTYELAETIRHTQNLTQVLICQNLAIEKWAQHFTSSQEATC